VAERLFLDLEIERVRHFIFADQAEAKKDVADYIGGCHNGIRPHRVLDNLSPWVFERNLTAETPIAVS